MKAHQLGEDAATDIFAVGFSGTDVVGHTYGSDSQETMDQLLRLDLVLDNLFEEIDSKIGLANTVVVLTADHGLAAAGGESAGEGLSAQRARTAALPNALSLAFEKRFPGIGALLVEFYSPPDFYLNTDVIREHGLSRTAVEATGIEALFGHRPRGEGLYARRFAGDAIALRRRIRT